MPGGKDIPDWGGTYTNTFFQPLFDHGELAARLGSLVTFDRRGALVWLDSFESGLGGWSDFHDPGAGSFSLTADRWHHPPFCARLTTGTAQNDLSYIRRDLAFPGADRLGVAFLVNAVTTNNRLRFIVDPYIDGIFYRIALALNLTAPDELSLAHQAGTTVLDTAPDFINGTKAFNFVKLVFNTDDLSIPRIIVNSREYDTSAYRLLLIGGVGTKYINITLESKNLNAVGVAQNTYLDSVIFTAVEP